MSAAAFNLGQPDDCRVPHAGLHHQLPTTLYVPTAPAVIDIESPDNETGEKLDFHANTTSARSSSSRTYPRSVTGLGLVRQGRYERVDHSRLLGQETVSLEAQIGWPPIGDGAAQPQSSPPHSEAGQIA